MTANYTRMTKLQQRELQKAALETLPVFDETDTLAVTLTMKQRALIDNYFHNLDEIEAAKNLRHFINLMSREVFKSAHRRKRVTIQIIPSLQFSLSGRLHYHALIRVPSGVDRGIKHWRHCLASQGSLVPPTATAARGTSGAHCTSSRVRL